jgi:hypothetical protein
MADAFLIDMPLADDDPAAPLIHVAAIASPWKRQAVVERRHASDRLAGSIMFRATIGEVLAQVPYRPSGRRVSQSIHVRLDSGALESVSQDRLLAGANLAAIQASNGAWEILQFQFAEERSADEWVISHLLRGQRGTDDIAHSGIHAGAAFVLLDRAVQPVTLSSADIDPLTLVVGPMAKPLDDPSWQAFEHGPPLRRVLPPAPVHVRARRTTDGGHVFTWVRRGRLRAEDFDATDIPLAEPAERYRVRITTASGQTVRDALVSTNAWTYPSAAREDDLGSALAGFSFEVCQEGRVPGVGLWAGLSIPQV